MVILNIPSGFELQTTSPIITNMPIVHIVLFEFKPTIGHEAVADVRDITISRPSIPFS